MISEKVREQLRLFRYKYISPKSKESRNLLRDFTVYSGVMAACTLIGLLFRRFGFSDATIITVYILGVLVSAVLVTSYISSIVVSFAAMIVFNFFFTEPLFTLHAYDAEYPVTFVVMLIVSFISCSIATRLKAIAIQSDATRARTKLLFDTASQLHKISEYDEILETTCRQLAKIVGKPVILYEWQPTRHHRHPVEFYRDYHGVVVTDGLQQYHLTEKELEGFTNANCWTHGRRFFADACKAMDKKNVQAYKSSVAHQALELIGRIFEAEGKLKDLSPKDRLRKRKIKVSPLVEAFFAWIREQVDSDAVLPKSKTADGLHYFLNQEKYLKVFLRDGNVPIDTLKQ